MGEVQYDERLGHGLHPGPGHGDELAEEEEPVVPLPERRDHLPRLEPQAFGQRKGAHWLPDRELFTCLTASICP
jgi:hypothetical protein